MSTTNSKPMLYNGHRVPFDKLEPEPFASFVCGALQIIGQRFGWKDFSQPELGVDGGFDVEARTDTGQVVCIQCKRYQDPISVPELANELAKVAINSCLDQAEVVSYLLITSGLLRQKLRKALRVSSRQDIRKESIEKASCSENFKDLRLKLNHRGLNVSDVVGSFVDNIELRVWSGTNLDDYLGVDWCALQSLMERTFSVHTTVREHPRPEFDKQSYLAKCEKSLRPNATALRLHVSNNPAQIFKTEEGDPLASQPKEVVKNNENFALSRLLEDAICGRTQILHGPGGAGKTTSVEILTVKQARRHRDDPDNFLPVMLDLAAYQNSLDQLINSSLSLQFGTWRGMPDRLLLLLDGLDRVPRGRLTGLQNDIKDAQSTERVSIIATCRTSGPRHSMVIPSLSTAWKLASCSVKNAIDIARSFITDDNGMTAFVDAWLPRARTDQWVTLPQAVAACVRSYTQSRSLPKTRRTLLQELYTHRIKRELHRKEELSNSLAEVPFDSLRVLAAHLAYVLWFQAGLTEFQIKELQDAIQQVIPKLRSQFGLEDIKDLEALSLLVHTGLVEKNEHGFFNFEHDSMAALLASDILAETWRLNLLTLQRRQVDDVWVLASSAIPEKEQTDYLDTVLGVELTLFVDCARELSLEKQAEEVLIQKSKVAESRYSISIAAAALGRLATKACVDFLRQTKSSSSKVSPWHYAAGRALAEAGDPITLEMDLESLDLDEDQAGKFSGGTHDTWRVAPPLACLSVARGRLESSTNQPLAATIRTIAEWGGPADVPSILGALKLNNQGLISLRKIIVSLARLDENAARMLLEEQTESADPYIFINFSEVAQFLGYDFDISRLIALVFEDYHSERHSKFGVGTWTWIRHEATKILCKASLDNNSIDQIVEVYPLASLDLKLMLWQIATKQEIEKFSEFAQKSLLNGSQDRGGAANFLMQREWLKHDNKSKVAAAMLARFENIDNILSREQCHDLYLLVLWGFRNEAIPLIHQGVMQLLVAKKNLKNREGSLDLALAFSDLSRALHPVASTLSVETIQSILTLDLSMLGMIGRGVGPCVKTLCDLLDNDQIDTCILSSDPLMADILLIIAAPRGPTEVRINHLIHSLNRVLVGHVSSEKNLQQAMEILWSPQVSRRVINAIASCTVWCQHWNSIVWPVMFTIANMLSKEMENDMLEKAIQISNSAPSREVLSWLRDATHRL